MTIGRFLRLDDFCGSMLREIDEDVVDALATSLKANSVTIQKVLFVLHYLRSKGKVRNQEVRKT